MKNKINSIDKKIDKILKLLDSKTLKKAKQYDELIKLLENIKIEVVHTKEVDPNNGEFYIKVEYHIEPTKIYYDENETLHCDETFRSLNLLNLIDFDTQLEVQKEIEILKEGN
jgi:hypothetical protein